MNKIGLGGGCHWCTEAVFQAVAGVTQVEQGYIKSTAPANSWSEAVVVHFAEEIDLELLIDIHLQTHNSTSDHSRRKEYRSAIYYFNQNQKQVVEILMTALSLRPLSVTTQQQEEKYITQVLEFVEFKPSRESIQHYYKTRPDAPFCKRYIDPKLKKVQDLIAAKNN